MLDVFTLHDEHKQEIEVNRAGPREWWWRFVHSDPEVAESWTGPFMTQRKAIDNAEAFCNEAAPE